MLFWIGIVSLAESTADCLAMLLGMFLILVFVLLFAIHDYIDCDVDAEHDLNWPDVRWKAMVILDGESGYLEYLSPKLTEVTAACKVGSGRRNDRLEPSFSMRPLFSLRCFFTFGENSNEMLL